MISCQELWLLLSFAVFSLTNLFVSVVPKVRKIYWNPLEKMQ